MSQPNPICDMKDLESDALKLYLSKIAWEAIRQRDELLKFAKQHHQYCEECEGTGKIFNNADPTSGQWVYCPYSEAIRKAEGL